MSLSKKTKDYIRHNCKASLAGKTVLVTGANSGVGFKTVETVIYLGGTAIMACRNPVKAEKARKKLLCEYPGADIRVMMLDMASLRSIDSFLEKIPAVDVFVNNAGVLYHPGEKTKDGFDMVMGTNYLGVYYLSEKLLPKLEQGERDVIYINTISIIHKIARVNYRRFFESRGSYARSKLCTARYTEHLAEKYAGTNIRIYMNHPGMTTTSIVSHIVGDVEKIGKYVPINSPEKSALSVVWLMSNDIPPGSVVGPNKGFGGWGYPEINRTCRRARKGIDELLTFTGNIMEGR